jgi:dCMP deaminase
MPSTNDLYSTYIEVAYLHSNLSKALRLKVGACLVTSSGICIPGYNGTPSGSDNHCEEYHPIRVTDLITKPEVIHAELNCILKCAKEGVSCTGATMFITHAPCRACSAMILQSGIKKVVYREAYRDKSGVEYLRDNKVEVVQF